MRHTVDLILVLVVLSLAALIVMHQPILFKTENVRLRWRYQTDDVVISSPAVYNGVVYVGSSDCRFYALNASTGDLIWKFHTEESIWGSSATFWNGVVYFGSLDCDIYALNATDGTKIWGYTTGSGVASSPTVYQGVVYVGSRDWYLYCLNATTGMLEWKYYAEGLVDGSPSVYEGVLYVGSYRYYPRGSLHALNVTTGELIWRFDTSREVCTLHPQVHEEIVYFGSWDNNVYALDAMSGEKFGTTQRVAT